MKLNKLIPIIAMILLVPIVLAIPNSINIQGKLTNTAGTIQTGTYNFTFRIYDDYTVGSLLYESNVTTATDSRGVYDIILQKNNLPFN